MYLDFLCEQFTNCEVLPCNELVTECLYIRNPNYSEPIKVFYALDDYDVYTICFATQHLHFADKEKLVDTISKFANGSLATIEFYDNGKNRFGGQIETKYLSNITYDSLREYFGYTNYDISNLTFRVYAWNKDFCYKGSFIKETSNHIVIVKKSAGF